jgi:hypothetical protein
LTRQLSTPTVHQRVNVDRDRRGVDLEEGDGAQDLGYDADILNEDVEDGWFFDPWFAGNDGFIDLNPEYELMRKNGWALPVHQSVILQ